MAFTFFRAESLHLYETVPFGGGPAGGQEVDSSHGDCILSQNPAYKRRPAPASDQQSDSSHGDYTYSQCN